MKPDLQPKTSTQPGPGPEQPGPGLLADPPGLLAYTEFQRLRNLAPKTIKQRSRVLRRLASWLDMPLGDATPADLRKFLGRPRTRTVSRATHLAELRTLTAFYAALRELE